VRTLPLRLAPVDGESLPGYVARYSHTFGVQPGDVLSALGLGNGGSIRTAGRYGVWLSPDQLERVAFVTAIPAEVLEGMLLARFAGRAFACPSPTQGVVLASEPQAHETLVWSSRFCPDCLRDPGAWLLRWQLGWSVVCVGHRMLLARGCPHCGSVPRIGRRSRWPRDHDGHLSDPARCSSRHRGELCRASLAEVPAVSVAGNTPLLAAQRRLDALLDGEHPPLFAGEQLEPLAYLRDLRVLSILLDRHTRLAGNQTPADSNPRPATRQLLDDRAALADVLPEALRLADLPDRATLADAIRELADQRYRADGRTLKPSVLGEVSTPLRDALRSATYQAVWAPPSGRLGFHPSAYRHPDDLDDRLQACHVPQLFWAEDYERELAEMFDFDDFSRRLARRFCSILLARMLTPLDWHAAVRYLDFPEQFINGGYNTTFAKLRQHGRFDELANQIKRLANEHAREGLIDYKRRRSALSDWAGIDPRTWQLLQPRPVPRSSRPGLPAHHALASVWLWCELTSGHEHAAPAALPTRSLFDQTLFIRRALPAMRDRLLLLGELLLNTPVDARQTLPTRLAAALHRRGHLVTGKLWHDDIDPVITTRILALISAHTGVDLATLTTTPAHGTRATPAVAHARLLAAALLRRGALASWATVAATLGGRAEHHGSSYRTAIEHDSGLAAEIERLAHAVEAWEPPARTAPATPHSERMRAVATATKTRAVELFTPPHTTDQALRISMVACREHTDLTWDDIAHIHNVPAYANWSQATVSNHCRDDPDFAQRYQRLLENAHELRREAGFANAHLKRGVALNRPTASTEPVAVRN
jgi:TniQ